MQETVRTTAALIQEIVADTNIYLKRLRRRDLLWLRVANHQDASPLMAEPGDVPAVPRRILATKRLLDRIFN